MQSQVHIAADTLWAWWWWRWWRWDDIENRLRARSRSGQ